MNELFEIRKTTNGEFNRGVCGSANNCRFKGTTTVFAIVVDSHGSEFALKRRMDADAFVAWARNERPEGFDVGDPELSFLHSEAGAQHLADHDWKGEA